MLLRSMPGTHALRDGDSGQFGEVRVATVKREIEQVPARYLGEEELACHGPRSGHTPGVTEARAAEWWGSSDRQRWDRSRGREDTWWPL